MISYAACGGTPVPGGRDESGTDGDVFILFVNRFETNVRTLTSTVICGM
jgi:hypothetical protein